MMGCCAVNVMFYGSIPMKLVEKNYFSKPSGPAAAKAAIHGQRPTQLLTALVLLLVSVLVGPPLFAQDGAMPQEGKLAIDMEPFTFPMFERGRLVAKVSMTLTLVVRESGYAEAVRLRLPQIRSDFLGALTTLSRQRFNVNKPIDPDIVRVYLSQYLNYRLGEGKADVYVKQALINPA